MSGGRRTGAIAFALGALVMAAAPLAAQDGDPGPVVVHTIKPWTVGTTHAANEVVGERSGLRFRFLPPPVNDQPPPINDMPHLIVNASPLADRVQVFDVSIQPPPTNDLPPGPIAVRVRLLPPGPTTPARIELELLDMTDVTLLGPTGEPLALCTGTGGQ